MIVTCIDDKNQPPKANVIEGKDYKIVKGFVNPMQEKVYIVAGVCNEGKTKMGFSWFGYKASRFKEKSIIESKKTKFGICN